ncbi:hypothetical protein OC846_003933 [Tilletia horrida]|uniref:REJ domain-containing protein n=1 Tax=Tilletia horrida TaxID=155126 RepID=A0AAN6GTX1_9BASI|nr:hypothetical protein OC846_003933 [Tilletia horrida]
MSALNSSTAFSSSQMTDSLSTYLTAIDDHSTAQPPPTITPPLLSTDPTPLPSIGNSTSPSNSTSISTSTLTPDDQTPTPPITDPPSPSTPAPMPDHGNTTANGNNTSSAPPQTTSKSLPSSPSDSPPSSTAKTGELPTIAANTTDVTPPAPFPAKTTPSSAPSNNPGNQTTSADAGSTTAPLPHVSPSNNTPPANSTAPSTPSALQLNPTTSYVRKPNPASNPNGVLNGGGSESDSRSAGFFNNPGAVGGTFAAVGILVLLLLASAFVILRRRRKARKLAEDVNIAVSAAAAHKRTPFEDDDDEADRMRPSSQAFGVVSNPALNRSVEGGQMFASNSSSQLHASYGASPAVQSDYGQHSPMNSMGSMSGMGMSMGAAGAAAAAAAHHQNQAYYNGRPGSSGNMDGAAAAAAYDHYYAQQAQGLQAYDQQQSPNPYMDHGMTGAYYHRLPVDQPQQATDAGFAPEIQAYFAQQLQNPQGSPLSPPYDGRQGQQGYQPVAPTSPNEAYAALPPPAVSQQQADANPFGNGAAATGAPPQSRINGAASPLGNDTILDGEGMPFANRRTSGRRSANGAAAAADGSKKTDSSTSASLGYLALPFDGDGSLTASNRDSSASTFGGAAPSSAADNAESLKRSVRTSDGNLFTIHQ